MLNKNIIHLLALTNVAINSEDRSVSIDGIDLNGIDWNYIVNVSKKQGVSAILIDAIKKSILTNDHPNPCFCSGLDKWL